MAVNSSRPEPSWLRRRRPTRMPREVLVLGVIAFCVAVGFGVLIPVLPVFARSFGVDNFAVGAVVSVFALMRLLTAPFCGRMIRRAGERVILALGIFIVAVSSGLAGISQSYQQLLILRGVGGFGSAMFTVSATTLLLTSVEAGLRGRASGVFQAGFLIGGMAGPAVGGLLSAISLTAPFFFYAGTLAVAGTVGLLMLGRSGAGPSARRTSQPVPLRQVVRDRSYQAACVASLAPGMDILRRPHVVGAGSGGRGAPSTDVVDGCRVCLRRGGPDARGRHRRASSSTRSAAGRR